MKSLSANPAPAAPEPEDNAQNTRLEALSEITLAAFVISAICILLNFQTWGASSALSSYPLWFNTLLCAGFGLLNWYRQPSFQVRSALLVAVLYGAAVGALFIFGLGAAGVPFLIAATVLATILLGFQVGAAVAGLSAVTGIGFIYLYLATPALPQLPPDMLNSWGAWASIGGNLTLVFAILIVPQRHVWESQAFVLAVSKQKQELLETRATLQKQTRQMEMASAELAGVNIQLQEQSRTLERRAQQLAAAAEIGRAATSSLDLTTLLETSVNLIRDRFGFYHASVFIIESGSDIAELRESTGEAGRQLKARRHKLAIGSKSLVGTATSTRRAVIVQDVTADPNYYPNPLLPDTRAEAVLPLVRGDTVLGAVDVQSIQPGAFSESDLAILSAITDQLSVAIQNARLYTETQQAVSENAALFKISAALATANSLQDILDVVVQNALPKTATRAALLGMHSDPDGRPLEVEVQAHFDMDGRLQRTGLRVPVAALPLIARLQSGPIVVPDIYSTPDVDPVTRETMAKLEMISACILPLRSSGHLSGALIVMANQPGEYSAAEQNLLRSVIDQVMVTLDKFRLLGEARRRAEQSTAAAEIGRAATATFDLPSLLETSVNLIRDRFGFYHASVFIVEPGSQFAELRESTGEAGRKLKERKHKLAIGSKSLVGAATATREPVVVQDVRADPGYYPNPLLPDTRAEAVLPMLSGDQVIGAVDVQSTTAGAFIESEVGILATIVGQLAVAVQNARLYVETQSRLSELATLNEVSRAISASIDLDLVFRAVREHLLTALGTDNLYLGLYDAGRNQISFPFMIERGQLIPFEAHTPTGRMQYVLKQRQPLLLQGDAAQIAEQLKKLGITSTGVAKSYLGVPLALGDRAIGVLAAQDFERANSFNTNHLRILTTVADQLAVAIQNARLYAETQERLGELATLNQLSRAFTATLDLEEVFRIVREQVPSVMNTTDIALALYDDAQDTMSFPFALERGQELHLASRPVSGLTGHILRTRAPVLLQGTLDEVNQKSAALGGIASADDSLSYFGVPLVASQRIVGALAVESYERLNAFDENHQRLFTTIADQLAVTIQNARLYAETQARLGEIAALNEISHELASTLDLTQVYQIIRHRLAQVMGTHDLVLALYDEVQNVISFAFAIERGQDLHLPPRPAVGKTGYIIRTQAPLLIQGTLEEVRQRADAVGGTSYEAGLQPSYYGIPLIVGQRVIGVLAAQDFERFNAFDSNQQRLMITIGGQLAVTLQNTSLFSQTQASLAETEDLYQGSADLNAANTFDHILGVIRQYTVAGEGTHIVSISLFDQPFTKTTRPQVIDAIAFWSALPPEQVARLPRRFRVADFPAFDTTLHPDQLTVVEDFATNPVLSAGAQALYQKALGAQSVIFVPLRVGDQWIGYINLLYPQPRKFSPASLRQLTALSGQAAVAINSLRLFEDNRNALAETDVLYHASADLNTATTYQDILEVFQRHTLAGEAALATLNLFDQPFSETTRGQTVDAVAVWTTLPPDQRPKGQMPSRRRVEELPDFDTFMQADRLTVIEDFATTPRLTSEPGRAVFVKGLGQRAGIFAPLKVGDQWIGYINAFYPQPRKFGEAGLRQLTALAGQAAAAVNSLRLFEETRSALAENATLFKISSALTEADSMQSILEVIIDHAMPPGCTRSGLLWIIYDEQGVPVEIEVRAHLDITGEYTRLGLRLPAQAGPFMHQFKSDPVAIDNIDAYPALDSVTRETMRQMHMIATCFIPIFMGGRLAGVMTTSASNPVEFHARDIAVLRGVSDLAAVTLEKLQLAEETRRHAEQLTAATEIGRAATASFDLRSVLATTVNLIRDRFGFYHASIFIIEPGSNIAELRESTGEAGEQLKARKHRLAVGSKSLVGTATAQQQPVVVQDVRADPSYYPNPLLPDTRAEAVIPLMAGDTVVGALDVQSTLRGAFAPGDIAILSTIASQLAVAVQNAGLFAQTQDAMAENASLFITSRALSEVKTAHGLLEAIAAHAMPQGATRTALLWLHYNDKGEPVEIEIRAHLDITGEYNERLGLRLPVEAAPLLQHLPPEPMIITNVETDPQLDAVTRETLRRMKMVSTCLIPLFMAGRLVGIITTSASQQTEFQPQEVSVLRGVADLLGVTLEKLQLAEETQRRAEQLAAAAEIGRAATASFDLRSVLATTVNLIRDRFGFYHASIFIIEPGSNMAEVRESTGEAGRQLKARKHRLAVGSKSLVGTATAQQQPVVVQDVRADPSYYPNPLLPETRAEAVIPLIAGDTVVGALDVQSTLRGVFSPGDTAILSTVAGQLAVAVQNARLYEQTARWANRERLANQITTKIRAVPAGDIDGMLRTAVTELRQALGASRGAAQLTSEPVKPHHQPQVSAGQIKAILDQIIAERSGGNPEMAQSIRTKLMLKGVNPSAYTADTLDDPGLLARVTVIAAEMGVTPKLPWQGSPRVLEQPKEGMHG